MRGIHHRPGTTTAVLLIALLAPAIVACRPGALAGSGPEVIVTRDVAPFERIEAGSGIRLTAVIGPSEPLTVRTRQSIEPIIRTEVRDGTLHVDASREFDGTPVEVRLVAPEVTSVRLGGGVRATVDGVESDALEVWAVGGAVVDITGHTRGLTLDAAGGAIVLLGDLTVERATVTLAGGADAVIRRHRRCRRSGRRWLPGCASPEAVRRPSRHPAGARWSSIRRPRPRPWLAERRRQESEMRRFIVEVVILTIAMAATIGLLSLVEVGGVPLLLIEQGRENRLDILVGPLRLDLLVGLILAIGSSVVPLLLAVLFGRWYLRHPIGALVGADAVLFVAVATVSGWIASPFLVPEPTLLWLIVDSLAFTAVYVALDAALGFHRPHVGDRPRHRSLWARLDRMPATDRNVLVENLRLYEVWQTVTGYLQDIALARTPLRPLRGIGDRLAGASSAGLDALSAPAKVRVMLQQLGPTYVKLGQMVGSRRELLPADWAAEMERLQSDVPPFPWPVAAAIIEAELGRAPSELFASIDERPLGAASLAQVHRATLHDGRAVVVKIQRPEIGARVRADLGVMQELAEVAEDRFAFARRIGLRRVIERVRGRCARGAGLHHRGVQRAPPGRRASRTSRAWACPRSTGVEHLSACW